MFTWSFHGERRRDRAGAFAVAGLGLPYEVGLVVQARDPEHEADQEEEQEHRRRDHLRREAKCGRERVGRGVPNDAIDVPMLTEPGANVAHEPHEPGEGDRDEDQHVLRDHGYLSPPYLARLARPAEEKDVDSRDGHHGGKHRADLRYGQTDPDRRLDEVSVDAEEDDDE